MHDQLKKTEIAKFPATFGLRAYPGHTFRISFTASYVSDFPQPGTLYLYTQIQKGDQWLDFCKGTAAELRAQIVRLVSDKEVGYITSEGDRI